MDIIQPLLSAQILCLSFLAILFLQSGLDKAFNYKGNKEWLTGHFAKSPLNGSVPILLPLITLLEIIAGIFCAIGIFTLLFQNDPTFGIIGAQFSGLSLLSLFFGQRLANDYEGAVNLIPYFIVVVISLVL